MLSITNRKNLSVINIEPPLEWSLLLLKVEIARFEPYTKNYKSKFTQKLFSFQLFHHYTKRKEVDYKSFLILYLTHHKPLKESFY